MSSDDRKRFRRGAAAAVWAALLLGLSPPLRAKDPRGVSANFIDLYGSLSLHGRPMTNSNLVESGEGDFVSISNASTTLVSERGGLLGSGFAPQALTDLVVNAASSSTLTLQWSAPAADPITGLGTVTTYFIRISTTGAILTDQDFQNAPVYTHSFLPQVPGTLETVVLGGLDANLIHSIAIESSNDQGYLSERSQNSTGTTTSAPLPADPDQFLHDIARAPNGFLYAVGQSSHGLARLDITLQKYDTAMTLISSVTLNGAAGSGNDAAYSVAVDTANVVFAHGYSEVEGFFRKNWLGSFDANLNVLSSKTFTLTSAATSQILITPAGELLVAGNVVNGGNNDIWLARFDKSLVLQASATLNSGLSPSFAAAHSLDIDPSGNIYLAGELGPPGDIDIWLGKYDSSLVFLTSATKAGPGGLTDNGYAIGFGPNGEVFAAGAITNAGPNVDGWLARYDPNLVLQAEITIDGSTFNGADRIFQLEFGNSGNVVAAGDIDETSGGLNAWQAEYNRVLVLQSSSSYDNSGGVDGAFGLSVDTNTSAAYTAGGRTVTNFDVRVASFSILPPSSACADLTSVQTGPWSLTSTWSPPQAPTICNIVTVAAGHTVTVDITTAAAGATTVNGTLSFNRLSNSTLTLSGGDLTVAAGGHLDMGTQASVIPLGIAANLVLAHGSSAGQYGLIVNNGGDFTVRGATKTPLGYAIADIPANATSLQISASSSTNWAVGDVIAIGPTSGQGTTAASTRTITAIAGEDPLTLTWSGGLTPARTRTSTTPILVANISHNVLVRSSGTDTGANTAYIRNLVKNATSFSLLHGEFAYLGTNASSKQGVTFNGDGVKGELSSSTFRSGYNGLYFKDSSSNVLTGLHFVGNAAAGVEFNSGSHANDLWDNTAFENRKDGISFQTSNYNRITGNHVFANGAQGVVMGGASYNTFEDNWVYSNGDDGFRMDAASDRNTLLRNHVHHNANGILLWGGSANNLVVGGEAQRNSSYGLVVINGGRNTFAEVYSYGNSDSGLNLQDASSTTFANGALGYDVRGTTLPNSQFEVQLDAGKKDLTLKQTRIHPTGGIATTGLDRPGNFLLSYDQDYATGTARFQGDYTLAGATWTFDYAARLYSSTATLPKAMRGPAHTLTVVGTYDAAAVSQLISFEFRPDNLWHVDGSSSGLEMHSFAGILTGVDIPTVNPQFQVNFANITSASPGDRLDFVLIGGSPVAAGQKQLLFGPTASSFNSGRSRLTVAPDGGLELIGTPSVYTRMDRLDDSSTYYTFIDSGAFTAAYSTMTNMDGGGIQLSGNAGIYISSSGFDKMGLTASTNAYITARDLTSAATLYSNVFDLSRATTPATYAYNVNVAGSDANLEWLFFQSTGAASGEESDHDPGDRVNWTAGAARAGQPAGTALGVSSITWTWTAASGAVSYNVRRASDAVTVVASGDGTTFNDIVLDTNTPYGIIVESVHPLGGGPLAPTTTVYTLAMPPITTAASAIFGTSATITWDLNSNPAATTAEIQRSTDDAQFVTVASGAITSYTDFGLEGCSTYYFKVRNVNGDGLATLYDTTINFLTVGSTPSAPSGLTAQSLTGRRISLNWVVSPSSATTEYRLYYDAGTQLVDYATPYAVFPASVTSFTSPVLTSSAAYKFGLRTKNGCGVEEDNISVTASAAALDTLGALSAAITAPRSGQKVTGDHVTVAAELTAGDSFATREVLFQYKNSTSSTWVDIPSADPVHNANPDTIAPYYIQWRTLDLPTTGFDLRAVAKTVAGAADAAPPSITVQVDPANWEVRESTTTGGRVKLEQVLQNGAPATLRAADELRSQVVSISIPAGSLNTSTLTATVINNPTTTPAAPADATGIGSSVEITFSNNQSALANGQSAQLSISYPDEDNNSFVDGTAIRASELQLYVFDPLGGAWKKEFVSSVDTTNKTISGLTTHFSLFGLFAPSHTDLSSFLVYPVPYRPNNGDLNDGRHYAEGDPNSGIVFDLVPEGTTVRIYTVTGQLVNELNRVSSGRIQWDVRNRDGKPVASGGYVAVISSSGQEPTVRKLLIIR